MWPEQRSGRKFEPHHLVSPPPSPTGSSRSEGTPRRLFSLTCSQINLAERRCKGKQRATDHTEDEDITGMQGNSRASGKYTDDNEGEYHPMRNDQPEERRVHKVSNIFNSQSRLHSSYFHRYDPPPSRPSSAGRTTNVNARKQLENPFALPTPLLAVSENVYPNPG